MVELVDAEKHIDENEFIEFAKVFTEPLPDAFKDHYLKINGGYLGEEDVEADRWGIPIGGFIPIKYGQLTIEELITDIDTISPAESEYGPWHVKAFVPFAYDNGGNVVFMSLKERDYGCIYLYA